MYLWMKVNRTSRKRHFVVCCGEDWWQTGLIWGVLTTLLFRMIESWPLSDFSRNSGIYESCVVLQDTHGFQQLLRDSFVLVSCTPELSQQGGDWDFTSITSPESADCTFDSTTSRTSDHSFVISNAHNVQYLPTFSAAPVVVYFCRVIFFSNF